ncbi:YgcG family protein [Massilia sp. Dwa41.01b]|uniref:TPM domain-containing protein n=1 Tax=unclassified Massilia TaxID=2609279 RepID=UPI001601FC11|nr:MULTISPECIES: TPM domain-containing protein [unclassified Massilia]QNA88299.1 YgcG family protein [Massilia sp. Dwa41.01b]QNA99196.1 YgcG family protein [Massilia sp. Se16.2.3]
MNLLRQCWLLLLACMLAAPAQAQLKAVPPLTSHVTDMAGMLDATQRQRLEAVLAQHEAQTGNQIAVLLVKSTEPEAIEQYGIRVAEAWKIGRKGVDDGVILLVARDNPGALRRLRIEAGRGVQGVLTDAQSKRILQDVIAPHFRQNHYYEGLVAGVGAIATLLNRERFPAAQQQQGQQLAPNGGNTEGGGIGMFGILMLVFGFMLVRSIFRPRRPRLSRGGWGSGATGFILGNVIGNMGRGGGGFGGFSGGGGGFGGGGFSGGGGTFDGGGASGDW